jgi:hypothetical protein
VNTTSQVSDALRHVLTQPTRGVVGLVDDLLTVCRHHRLQLDWQPDRCRARSDGGEWTELADVALPKSVFRAVLARVAVLCNERTPNAVSPYGGRGELPAGANPREVIKVTFVNNPTEQKLELTTETEPTARMSRQHEQAGRVAIDGD